ncbi:hypothetical protein ACH5RR_037862 [Cinchona calisaya]|uniref:Glabrous enhancer-binding protein-like DBD domain-containing protein n=1 Tax=Cinchona calisaya TaxID=153742 RepID=A0ABD2Y7E6_9GENT
MEVLVSTGIGKANSGKKKDFPKAGNLTSARRDKCYTMGDVYCGKGRSIEEPIKVKIGVSDRVSKSTVMGYLASRPKLGTMIYSNRMCLAKFRVALGDYKYGISCKAIRVGLDHGNEKQLEHLHNSSLYCWPCMGNLRQRITLKDECRVQHVHRYENICGIFVGKLLYRDMYRFKAFPSADFDEFHDYVQEHGLTNLSQENLKSAVVFMEESFQKIAREHGRYAHFLDKYLDDRFQLSKRIWGPLLPPRQEMPNQDVDHKGKAVGDNLEGDLDYGAIDDHHDVLVDEKQDNMDIEILNNILEFKMMKNSGKFPEPDSDDLYRFLGRTIGDMKQDELVDRMLFLEENYNRIKMTKLLGDDVEFMSPSRVEIYNLSRMVWSNPLCHLMVLNQADYDAERVIDEDGANTKFAEDEKDEQPEEKSKKWFACCC